jgi:hypothetical protein
MSTRRDFVIGSTAGILAATVFANRAVARIDATPVPEKTQAPERKVEANRITSERDPSVQIRLPLSAIYVGADRWVLFGISDCELHLFVEADAKKDVQRLYWIQFEGYLPTKPNLHHVYNSPQHTSIGALDFYVDEVSIAARENDPDSDVGHVEALLRKSGYTNSAGMRYLRLVHLLDAQKRKELMIIYGENGIVPGESNDVTSLLKNAKDRISIRALPNGK